MIVFLKRLAGVETTQREVRERFKRNLNGFDERAAELEGIEAKLAGVAETVDKKSTSIRAAQRTDLSGEHKLNLPAGGGFGREEPGTT